MARLDRFDALLESEREAGELSAILATIAMKVNQRLEREKQAKNNFKLLHFELNFEL